MDSSWEDSIYGSIFKFRKKCDCEGDEFVFMQELGRDVLGNFSADVMRKKYSLNHPNLLNSHALFWCNGEDLNMALNTKEFDPNERVLILIFEFFKMSLRDIA